jgi:prepilin-type processing-associated H-X9-DG protein
LAVLNYESTNGRLPPAGLIEPENGCTNVGFANTHLDDCFDTVHGLSSGAGGLQFSWIILVLPFMEEQALYDEFQFDLDVYNQPTEPQSRSLGALLCPSDQAAGRILDLESSATFASAIGSIATPAWFAKANYAAFTSPSHIDHQKWIPGALGGFEPGERQGQKLSKITDGVSKTVLGSEVRTLDRDWDQRGAWALPWSGAALLGLNWHPIDTNVTSIRRYVPDPDWERSHLPNRTRQIFDQLLVCKQPAYAREQKMPCAKELFMAASARSLHPGGVNAVALDGHVGFISDQIDSFTFAYLISTNDGQASDVTEYLR